MASILPLLRVCNAAITHKKSFRTYEKDQSLFLQNACRVLIWSEDHPTSWERLSVFAEQQPTFLYLLSDKKFSPPKEWMKYSVLIPEMTMDLSRLEQKEYPDSFQVKRVGSKSDLEQWIAISAEGCPQDQTLIEDFAWGQFLSQKNELYLGFFQNQPCVVGLLVFYKAIVGLFSIYTRIIFRNKGLGFLFSRYLLEEARRKNCKEAILTSTAQAANLYQKLGFRIQRTFSEFAFVKNA